MATSNRFRRRSIYLLITLIWLVLISLPSLMFVLAARQQIQFGGDDRNHLRLFVVQEPFAEGLGIEWVRPSANNTHCAQTTVRYFMWVGEPDNVSFCQCYDSVTQEALSASQGSCPALLPAGG